MVEQATLMTLPPELRELIYEYVALAHTTRRVRAVSSEADTVLEFNVTTSAITATCRLIYKEYVAVANKSTTSLEFTATNMDFTSIMEFFHRNVDGRFLAILQQNKATILVNIVINNNNYQRDIADFYPWALFLINVRLEADYQSDTQTWMEIHVSRPPTEYKEQCVIDSDTSPEIRENLDKIRTLAGVFDGAVWGAYPSFFKEMQARYHRRYRGED